MLHIRIKYPAISLITPFTLSTYCRWYSCCRQDLITSMLGNMQSRQVGGEVASSTKINSRFRIFRHTVQPVFTVHSRQNRAVFNKSFLRGNSNSDRLPRCSRFSSCGEHRLSSCFTIEEKEQWLMGLDHAGVVTGSMRQNLISQSRGKASHSPSSYFQSFSTHHAGCLLRHLQWKKRNTP